MRVLLGAAGRQRELKLGLGRQSCEWALGRVRQPISRAGKAVAKYVLIMF